MCGIFGMISKKSRSFNKRAFCTMGVRNDSRGGDSCGVFIDGLVEYGIDKQKLFINFFRDSLLLNSTVECQVALGHCRKASVGKVSVETAQPVVLYNEVGEVDYVLIHNGTIYNYKELATKYIPEINIEGLTDSQVMARIFYHKGYDSLAEYIGGAVFVIHDYRINKSFIFKGESKKYTHSKDTEEERPLFFCWHNGRFCFSSIFETLYSFYYEEEVNSLPSNILISLKDGKLKKVKEYNRSALTQSKPAVVTTHWSENDFMGSYYGSYYSNPKHYSYKIKYNGFDYIDEKAEPLHGVFQISTYGYIYPNKKEPEHWLHLVGFFRGKLLKHPDSFKLLDDLYNKSNKKVTPEIELLTNLLDFNPHSDDCVQYYWYDGEDLMYPQGEWKWPMADWSCVFDKEGRLLEVGKKPYTGWTTDYYMYTYDEEKIKQAVAKKLCEGE